MPGINHLKIQPDVRKFVWLPLVIVIAATVTYSAAPVSAEEQPQAAPAAGNLLDLSLEQLMQVPVAGTLTETDERKIPASVTVITAEQIAVTPARNLLDLIEIYVPSAMWLSHSVGPVLAVRGIVADRNYKYLVLVNGVKVNNGVAYGALSELSLWDMADIEKVEIISGPGSVTYGPGAIAGVINITLKNAKTSAGTEVGGFYWNKYVARGGHISHGLVGDKEKKEPDVFGYFSWTDSLGVSPDIYSVTSTRSDYLGHDRNILSGRPAASYFGSFYGEPQIKAYIDTDFKNGWRFWTRYTDGLIPNATFSQTKYVPHGAAGSEFRDLRLERERQYIATLENKQKLNEDFELATTFSFSSTELKHLTRVVVSPDSDENNLRNMGFWVSENKFFGRIQITYDPKDFWKAAFGAEYSYTIIGPGWGRNRNNGFRVDDIISGPDSDVYGSGGSSAGQVNSSTSTYIPAGNGWKANAYAIFGEVNVDLVDTWSFLLSARVDKHSYTDYMFSPRAAIVNEFATNQFLKLVAQRSVRMNTEEEVYKNHYWQQSTQPEKLDTYELMYHTFAESGWNFKASTFYNDLQAIAWNSATRRTEPLGELKSIGFAIEAAIKKSDYDLGISHSYVKQLDWKMASGRTTNGISYSDYDYTTTTNGYIYSGTGSDLNNYSNHMTKLFSNLHLADKKITLHGDMHVLWGFQGGEDGLKMMQDSGLSNPAFQRLKDRDAYETLITANFSVTYHLNKSTDITGFIQNIPIMGENKRYTYSSGNVNEYPDKTGWIEEPIVVGAKFAARF